MHPWQSYVLAVHPGLDRDAVALALRARGIGCTIGTYASHLQPVYGPQKPLPVSADLFARHLAIPMHANLTDGGGHPGRGRRARGRRAARRARLTRPAVVPPLPLEEIAPWPKNRTVLVTGGAGWIGLRTVPLLLERGYRVRILDSMVRGDREAVTRLAEGGDVELVEQDVRYGGAVHQAMTRRHARHALRRGVDQQELGRPVRVDGRSTWSAATTSSRPPPTTACAAWCSPPARPSTATPSGCR